MTDVITSQPTSSNNTINTFSDDPPRYEDVISTQPHRIENIQNIGPNGEPVETANPENDQMKTDNVNAEQDNEAEEVRRRNQRQDNDCCFVCYVTDDNDCYLCQLISNCCIGIGNCTESCCEGCADCIHDCCESNTDSGQNNDDSCCVGCCEGDIGQNNDDSCCGGNSGGDDADCSCDCNCFD